MTAPDNAATTPKRRPGRPPKSRAPEVTLEEAPSRPVMRPDDSRAAAAQRAADILANFDGSEMTNNDFVAPKPPDGWTYEWKAKTVYNQEDPGRMMAYRRTGWAEVPANRHPDMMPLGYSGSTIERKGMILMERPQEITARFAERDRINARNQVRTKEEQLNAAPSGTFERQNKDAPLARVNKSYEPMEVPGDK